MGLLLLNLGTPDAPTAAALRRYLAEFLSDPRVVELPRALWLPLLYGVILPLRAPRSASAYRAIWSERGSPLRYLSEDLAAAVRTELPGVDVRLAMRYGAPSVDAVLGDWRKSGLRRLLVLPLYPQYAAATTASALDAVNASLLTWRWLPDLRWLTDYHAEPVWIDAVAASIAAYWQANGRPERLLFSFHGLPRRTVERGDPYLGQCQASAQRIAAALGLAESEWQLCFQSRVGRAAWLQPYTDVVLGTLPGQGVRRVDVVCPGFAVDCLETLEEIAQRGAEQFVEAGGERLRYIPALNAAPAHARLIADLARRQLAGWLDDAE